jgi:MoxR-like ATPase
VVKFDKSTSRSDQWISDLVEGHYDFFHSDLSEATNRFQISFAASHDQPVMIVGESGTGKEGIAKFIHKQWARRKQREQREHPSIGSKVGRFQVINCGGLSEHLAQSELFGYIKGSFTGADEHRLGKVFIAAGIDPLGRENLRTRKEPYVYDQADKDLADFRSGFEALDKADDAKKYEVFLSHIQPPLNRIFRRDLQGASFMHLIAALEDAERKLKRALEGSSFNEDFHARLESKAGRLLAPNDSSDHADEANDWDLKYALDEPIGTLFLDEFADLPLPVQTLLLRFLQSGEVQPLGYSGRVLGLKVRIIVATSDSRVAEFAGTPVTDDFLTPEELARPLRNDLLHRVRFQVIRAEPVVADNIERILREMIARKPRVVWHEDAIGYFVEEIKMMIKPGTEARPATKPGFIRRASFGHRRELQRVVDLVWEYAQSVLARGVRDAGLEAIETESLEAQKSLIARLWQPAMIVSTDPGASKAAPMETVTVKEEDIVNVVTEQQPTPVGRKAVAPTTAIAAPSDVRYQQFMEL